jgi:hypothetical protein
MGADVRKLSRLPLGSVGGGKDMLDKLAKYVPHISILSFILVAIFNIGFFYKVGIHFLGVIDINNLVYPLGFVLAVVLFASLFSISFLTDVSSLAQSHDAVPSAQVD